MTMMLKMRVSMIVIPSLWYRSVSRNHLGSELGTDHLPHLPTYASETLDPDPLLSGFRPG